VEEKVSASTKNQALSALLFLYRHVIGNKSVPLDTRARKNPNAPADWRWQWVFPQENRRVNTKTGEEGMPLTHETIIQRAVKEAVSRAGIVKNASCHTFRHSFAMHLLEAGYDIRTIQELMVHKNVSTTMVYTHVLNKGGHGVKSPVDLFFAGLG